MLYRKQLRHFLLHSDKEKSNFIQNFSESFCIFDGLLFNIKKYARDGDDIVPRLAVPTSCLFDILSAFHLSQLSSHRGINRLYLTVRDKFYIPSLYSFCVQYVKACVICNQMCQANNLPRVRPWEPRKIEEFQPLRYYSADVKIMPSSSNGYIGFLLLVDEVTKFVITIPIRSRMTSELADAIVHGVCLKYLIPERITFDADSSYLSELIQIINKQLGITSHIVMPSAHESNVSERYIQSISNALVSLLKNRYEEWPTLLGFATKAFNTTQSTITKYTPTYQVFLQEDRHVLDRFTNVALNLPCDSHHEYMRQMKQKYLEVAKVITETNKMLKIKQSQKHEDLHGKYFKTYKCGDLIYLLNPGYTGVNKSLKITLRYVGPCYVYECLSSTEITLATIKGEILPGSYHINRLKHCHLQLKSGKIVKTIDELNTALQENDLSVSSIDREPSQKELVNSMTFLALQPTEGTCGIISDSYPCVDGDSTEFCMVLGKGEKCSANIQGDIERGRYKNGHLEVLISTFDGQKVQTHWLKCRDYPMLMRIMNNPSRAKKIKIVGRPGGRIKKFKTHS